MTTTDPANSATEPTNLLTRRRALLAVAGGAGALISLPTAFALGPPFRLHDDHDEVGDATPAGTAQASPRASPKAATPASASPAATPATTEAAVTIQDFAFDPPEIEVAAGTTVMWTNQDQVAHTATNTDEDAFDTGTLLEGESGSHTFDTVGRFRYVCIFHADMVGVVNVV